MSHAALRLAARSVRGWFVSIGTTVGLLMPGLLGAHGGGLDAYGCYHDRRLGGYHCHRGPFAGLFFVSKAAMLDRLKEGGAEVGSTLSRWRPPLAVVAPLRSVSRN